MSNLAGSYKVGVGEAQSVDLREQERRARLLLLDGIREPSPQPIFGEPVKVELEDETSRRIKNTLGDVTEVLMNDPKSLMCISRSASAPVYPPNGHQVLGHPSNNHPMSGLPSIGHSMSGAPTNSHHMSGHPSSQLSGHSSNSLSMPGHAPNSQISGHSSYSHMVSSGHHYNSHLISGHQSGTHPMTGHQSNSHPMSHPQNNHQLTGHPSHTSTHPITGHPSHTSSNHQLPGHSSGHPGHPSNSHSMHATGHPSSNYMAGHSINAHSIPGHPSNGHSISGYSATGYSGAGHNAPSRPQAAKKVSLPANNVKPPNPNMPNMYQKTATDKRNTYNRQKPDSPVTSKFMYNTNYNAPNNQQTSLQQFQNQDTRSWNTDQKKTNTTSFSINPSYNSNAYNVTTPDISTNNVIASTCAPIWSCGPETPAIQMNPFHLPPCATPSTPNKPIYNIPSQNTMAQNIQPIPKYDAANTPSLKRPAVRPSHLKIERKPTSPIGVETILKEMTKPVPAPLTAIQTPRTEETGFAFPPEPKEELPFIKVDENANPSNLPQEQTPMDICQPSPMPQTKTTSPFSIPQTQSAGNQAGAVNILESQQPAKLPEYTSSLQDDLEMSESDDEVVPEKKDDPSEFLKSPTNNPVIVNNIPTPTSTSAPVNTPMETNSASSSSSESGDSDSDDDSSESNNSDSSSESSDEDTSSMKWGLSNFVDESRRNHSPAFRSLEMQKQLNNNKTTSAVCPPVQQPLSQFIVPDASVTAKSDLLSPIRSPAHPLIGPRTPPTPVCSSKDVCDGKLASANVSESNPENCVTEEKFSDALSPANESKVPLISDISNVCDERKDNVASKASDVPCSEVQSSPVLPSLTDSLNESKCVQKVISDKDAANVIIKPSPQSSDLAESSQENYPIKTRQKGTVSTKKKSSTKKVSNEDNNQKVDDANSPPIAKFKHPRACRKSNEKPAIPVPATKPEQTKEIKKRLKPTAKQKEIVNIEKNKTPQKTPQKAQSNIKKPTKAAIKQKNKINKSPKSSNVENKKIDIKNKKKKFTVENFLQSPTQSSDLHKITSPSPEKVSVTDSKKNSEPVVKASNSTSSVPKSTKSNSKNKTKNVEKLRRSVRCSERASSLSQSEEPSTVSKENTEETSKISQIETVNSKSSTPKSKKLLKKSGKSKSHSENLPVSIESQFKQLSPIPHNSAAATIISTSTVSTLTASTSGASTASASTSLTSTASNSDPSVSNKIMVCIPLSKLLRIPNFIQHIQESETGDTVKSATENLKQKKDVTVEKSSKITTNKSSQSKDFKDKPRTNQIQKNKKKSVSSDKKENTSKPLAEISKSSSIVNKNSGKSIDKPVCDVENKLSKKRKIEGDSKSISKKKPKSSLRNIDDRKSKEQIVLKTESSSQSDSGNKPKPLERCDSASSLNSLCSQRSSKSLKDKKDASLIHEAKRLKTSLPASILTKEIKQEKEDRPKVHIKKEPVGTDKNSKIRDKSSDVESKEKGDSWIDSHNQSSQFCHWDDSCKDEPKMPLESIMDNLNPNMSWDHFSPEMHKELKEASALKMLTDQGPIMPMDYYWTEGRKMKKMAELEKDPFQQAVKFYEAAVLYVLTSQQKEENCKNPDAVYQFYYETLSFTTMMLSKIKKLQSCPGSTEFKLLILCLKCQSLLNVKLYSLKIKEIKEQLEGVTEFFRTHCSVPTESASPTLFSLHQSRISSLNAVSSPHSVIPPSPNSVSSQTSGYASSDISGTLIRNSVCVPQTVLDTIYRQHTHLKNLHMGHDLWEQADMYMTRSNLKEFFKEVADQSEPLTLHSTIKELVSYMQKGICLVKNYLR